VPWLAAPRGNRQSLLSGSQRQQVFDFVAFLAQQQKTTSGTIAYGKDSEVPNEKRQFSRKQIFGCLDGQISISDDFDAPLDDFAEYM
jgi:Protein of unknown function (DUF2281)